MRESDRNYFEAAATEERQAAERAEHPCARQAHLEDRYQALERVEASLLRRSQEVDDLEAQLRSELEDRELELARESRRVEALHEQMRHQLCEMGMGPADTGRARPSRDTPLERSEAMK